MVAYADFMNRAAIIAGGRLGMLFEGEFPWTYCFVPGDCITLAEDGIQLAEVEYACSRWAERNMRFNDTGEGQHLFPDMKRPVFDLESGPIRHFLSRIELIHAN